MASLDIQARGPKSDLGLAEKNMQLIVLGLYSALPVNNINFAFQKPTADWGNVSEGDRFGDVSAHFGFDENFAGLDILHIWACKTELDLGVFFLANHYGPALVGEELLRIWQGKDVFFSLGDEVLLEEVDKG
ncbi:uncharacterized protein A4U43_C05F19240 [Asparagus officinalis]|uniref:Uncharacterized protein n=1 Tax=Asparagus officinalis TaxID=4686 RepID=A0A5P1ET02_ASPOF|nr:uncharacterized protein A4U43_C05F19240 [Asparagus officinalis]